MNYCTECRKVYSENVIECECQKDRFWKRGEIKPIPEDSVIACKDCGSTENLTYTPEWSAGRFKFGNECTCKKCHEELKARIAREEAMNYIVIDNDDNEIEFYDTKTDVEDMFEDIAENIYDDDCQLDMIILKIEKVDGRISADDFLSPKNNNIVIWDGELFRVEEVIEPEVEFDGDVSINW